MFLITILLHYIIGFGFLNRLGFSGNKWEKFGLAFPLGLGTATLAILVMDIFGIPLTSASTIVIFILIGSIFIYPDILQIRKKKSLQISKVFSGIGEFSIAESLILCFILFLFLISLWRCFYLPTTPYDSIVGIDLVAKYAAEEGRIDSKMFSDLSGQLSTQPFYAPFTALSQIIYRLAGHDFGKIWLSFMFLSLWVVLYSKLRKEIHPVLAGFLIVVLISIPEMYAYTFMVQTDFSNAVFICLSVIYAHYFLKNQEMSYFWISSLMFGFGVWSRSESIAFAASMVLLLFLYLYYFSKKKYNPYKLAIYFFGISFYFFALWNLFYLPVVLNYSPESFFKIGFWDPDRLAILWNGVLNILTATEYWGYIPYFFIIIVILNLIVFRKIDNLFILLWIIILVISFIILLYHLKFDPGTIIKNTFRRGTFKIWPIMVYYIGTSFIFKRLSKFLYKISS